ncbi:restriction endonuclease subunit S [Winogradskyella sp. PC D3.3]
MMEKRLTPQLRFPNYNDDWDKVILENITTKISDGIHSTPKYDLNGNYYFVNGNNLVDGAISINENTKKVSLEEFKKHKRPLNKNSILLSINGTIGNLALYNNENIVLGKSACYINLQKEIPINFYYYILQTPRIKKYFLSELTGSTIMNLSLRTIKATKLIIPSFPEQQKIASFLTDVDDKITKLTQKKTLLEQYKKGIMQKIFNQELRFKDDNGNEFPEWEEKKLGDLGNTLNGLTGKTKENFGSGKPYIQYKQIFDSSKINIDNCGLVDITITDKQTKVQYGDIFFTTSSETPKEIGTASVLLDEVEEMYLNSFCFGFRVKQSLLYPSFSQFLFRSSDFRKKMIPLAQGSTRYNISKSAFVKLKVSLPNIEEQTKIANFLSDIDLKLEALNTKIENSKSFKKGLLQQMFV